MAYRQDPKQIPAELSFDEHIDALRRMVVRILLWASLMSVLVFCLKEQVFRILLAPLRADFPTFRVISSLLAPFGSSLPYTADVSLIATDVSSQFTAHLSASVSLGLLLVSPYIAYSILSYILPALYAHERRYASRLSLAVYVLFIAGLLLSYYIMFPLACRFLSGYTVSEQVTTMITIDSYMDLFMSLSLMLALTFQLPVAIYFLTRTGLINADMLRRYRRHSIVLIFLISAIITPPDVITLLLMGFPLWILYETGILVAAHADKTSGEPLSAA